MTDINYDLSKMKNFSKQFMMIALILRIFNLWKWYVCYTNNWLITVLIIQVDHVFD